MRDPHLTVAPGFRPARAWPPLVAVAHGSRDPRAAATITDLMSLVRARVRRSGLAGLDEVDELDVRAAYLGHSLPSVPDVLACIQEAHAEGTVGAVVLPLLLTEAYHSQADLPAVLREARGRLPRLRISYGSALGPHPRLLHALDRRLAEAGLPAPEADTAVVLAAAGSSRPAANAAVARLAAAWQAARGWRAVVPAYASATGPAPGASVAALRRAGAPRVAVATYLLAPGVFADQARETSLAAGAAVVSAPLWAAPEGADVIIERYWQAAGAAGAARAS
jgi:sirohydrochlorin ferrochelatase